MTRLLCAVLVFASGTAAEAADRSRVPPHVAELLTLSGVERQLAQLPESVADGFNATAGRFSSETAERIRVILKDAYRRDAIYPVLTSAMSERYDARQARVAVQALRTPLFRRLQALEDDLIGREGEPRIRAFSEQLPDRPPGVERHVLVRRLDSALGATSAQIEILTSTVAAFGAVSADGASVRDVRAAMQEQVAVGVKNQVLLTMLCAYETATDDELREYLAFWESSAGRWFTRAVNAGLLRAMSRAAETAARKIRAMAPPSSSRP